MPSLSHVMTGGGVPVTSHTKLVGWFITTETFDGRLPSRTSGGTENGCKEKRLRNILDYKSKILDLA